MTKEPPKREIGYVLRWEIDDPNDNMSQTTEVEVNDHRYISEKRYQQLEQVARELYEELKVYMAEEMVLRGATPKEAADRASFCMAKQRYKLEALGVSLDEQ